MITRAEKSDERGYDEEKLVEAVLKIETMLKMQHPGDGGATVAKARMLKFFLSLTTVTNSQFAVSPWKRESQRLYSLGRASCPISYSYT